MHPEHFFKYYTAQTAKIVLATQKVRWNSPLNFNDPFDCFFSLDPKFDIAQMNEKRRERFLDLMTQEKERCLDPRNPFFNYVVTARHLAKGLPRKELEERLSTIFEECGDGLNNIGVIWREIWKNMMADLRLFCVCEINDNLLLWAHYTNNHTGAVFQFECITEFDVPLLVAQPVLYSDDAPGLASEEEWLDTVLGFRPLITGEEVTRRLVTTKARAFEHEKEWRVVSTRRPDEDQGYEDTKFFPREISKVFHSHPTGIERKWLEA